MDRDLKERIISLPDDDLLNLYERDYDNYRPEALEYAKEEIKKREIQKKIWFYNDLSKQYGPFTKDEIIELIKKKKIRKDHYVWHEGLNNWVLVQTIGFYNDDIDNNNKQIDSDNNGIKPPLFNPELINDNKESKQYDYDGGRSGVKVAGILMIVISSIWLLISILQLMAAIIEYENVLYVYAGWNMVVSIGMIIVGQGILKHKKWSYSWGVGTASVNMIFHIIEIIAGEININIFFAIMHIAILILLIKNKIIFKKQNTEKEKATNE